MHFLFFVCVRVCSIVCVYVCVFKCDACMFFFGVCASLHRGWYSCFVAVVLVFSLYLMCEVGVGCVGLFLGVVFFANSVRF